MKHKSLAFGPGFRVAFDSTDAQAAEMVIPPGESEGGPGNRHRCADQWLYVVSGTGQAQIEGLTVELVPHVLLLIARGERHEVRNTGTQPLATLNFFTPPAFDQQGEALPAGES